MVLEYCCSSRCGSNIKICRSRATKVKQKQCFLKFYLPEPAVSFCPHGSVCLTYLCSPPCLRWTPSLRARQLDENRVGFHENCVASSRLRFSVVFFLYPDVEKFACLMAFNLFKPLPKRRPCRNASTGGHLTDAHAYILCIYLYIYICIYIYIYSLRNCHHQGMRKREQIPLMMTVACARVAVDESVVIIAENSRENPSFEACICWPLNFATDCL